MPRWHINAELMDAVLRRPHETDRQQFPAERPDHLSLPRTLACSLQVAERATLKNYFLRNKILSLSNLQKELWNTITVSRHEE